MSGIPTTGEATIVIQMPESAGGGLPEEAPSPSKPQSEGNKSKDPVNGDKKGQVKTALAVNAVKSVAKQAVSAAVSNIGLATGNYYLQSQVEEGVQLVSKGIGIGAAFASNVYVGIAAVAMEGVSMLSDYFKQKKEMDIENFAAAQYAKRLGFTVGRK
jgi:hypothetical protein